jgi:ribonuclease J
MLEIILLIITIHGGVNEIGGNKIILEDKDAKILLDFGMSYKDRAKFYSEPWLIPRDEHDLLEFGILPNIDGIYKFDDKSIDAFFLSHAHTDHYKYVSFLNRGIDMYCGKGTKSLLDIFNKVRYSNFEHNLADIQWNTFSTNDVIKIGSLSIEPIHVDHSIPAAYAFIIHTSSSSIAYTGDLRLHGSRSDLTRDFIEKARDADIDAILCEGTNLGRGEVVSEDEVYNKVRDVIQAVKGLVIAGFSIADIDRFRTFYRASLINDRRIVITPKQAYLLNSLKDIIDLPDKDNISVYRRNKKRYYQYEQEMFDEYQTLDAEDIKKNQSKYVLVLQFQDLRELVDIKPNAGSCYIYSSSEPFNEESEIEFDRFNNWLDHFALPMYHIHASGHIMPMDLRHMLEEINPNIIIPIHTEHANMFARWCSDISQFIIPERSKPMELK